MFTIQLEEDQYLTEEVEPSPMDSLECVAQTCPQLLRKGNAILKKAIAYVTIEGGHFLTSQVKGPLFYVTVEGVYIQNQS